VQDGFGDAGAEQAVPPDAFEVDDHRLAVAKHEILQYRIQIIQTEPGLIRPGLLGPPGQALAAPLVDQPGLLEEYQVGAQLDVERALVQVSQGWRSGMEPGEQLRQRFAMVRVISPQASTFDELEPHFVFVLMDEARQGDCIAAGLQRFDHGRGLGTVAEDNALVALAVDMDEINALGFAQTADEA